MTDRKPTCVACKGAGGANYTAGTGIVIENNEISADTSVLATKTELPPTLTALSPININEGNQINLKDFTLLQDLANFDFTTLFEKDGNFIVAKKDVVFYAGLMPTVFMAKGTKLYIFHAFIALGAEYSINLGNLSSDTNDTITYSSTKNDIVNNTTYYELLIHQQDSAGSYNKRTQFTYWVRE